MFAPGMALGTALIKRDAERHNENKEPEKEPE